MSNRLKQSTIKSIISDWDLFTLVGKSANIQPTSTFTAVKKSSKSVMQYNTLNKIAKFLKTEISDLVEDA